MKHGRARLGPSAVLFRRAHGGMDRRHGPQAVFRLGIEVGCRVHRPVFLHGVDGFGEVGVDVRERQRHALRMAERDAGRAVRLGGKSELPSLNDLDPTS